MILDRAETTVDYSCCALVVVFNRAYKRRGANIAMEQGTGQING
jgi:hypothetical protein